MSASKTLVVVGLIAPEEDDTEPELPDDLPELSAYELDIRFRVGRDIPNRVLIFLSSQDEMTELLNAIEGVDIELDLMTDDPTRPKPENLDALWELLPKSESGSSEPPPDDSDNPFKILQ